MQGDVKGGKARWFIGRLGPQETKVIRITGIPGDTGVVSFCTDVKYNLPAVCTSANIIQPELRLTKRAPSEVLLCDTIPITFVVTNTGTGTAKNVQIEESLPSGLMTLEGESYVVHEVGS